MRRQLLLAAAGAVALALSVRAVLVGRAVLATPGEVARATTSWPSDTRVAKRERDLADRAAASLLATDRAERFGEIVRIYRDATALPVVAGQPTGPIRIAHLIPTLHTDRERAQALVMASTLLAMAAGDGLGVAEIGRDAGSKALLLQALGGFRAAVASDDRNEAAKFDLELLLRQAASRAPNTLARRQEHEERQAPELAEGTPAEEDGGSQRGQPRRRLRHRKRLLMTVTLATPFALLAGLVGLVPIAVALLRLRTARRLRRELGLEEPPVRARLARPIALACVFALLGLAAARPSIRVQHERTARTDAEVIVVLDSSRSMLAASGAGRRVALPACGRVRPPAARRAADGADRRQLFDEPPPSVPVPHHRRPRL